MTFSEKLNQNKIGQESGRMQACQACDPRDLFFEKKRSNKRNLELVLGIQNEIR